MFTAIAWVVIFGAIGGIANSVMTDKGILLPGKVTVAGEQVWRPGILLNIFLGGLAALVSWLLYSSGNMDIMNPPDNVSLFAPTLGMSILIGIAGPRYLSDELDKNILKKSTAMAMKADPDTKDKIMNSNPLDVLEMAVMHEPGGKQPS